MHFEKITNFWCSDRGIIGRLSGLGGWPVDASQEPEIEPERAALRGSSAVAEQNRATASDLFLQAPKDGVLWDIYIYLA
jgi:hypothetical protein